MLMNEFMRCKGFKHISLMLWLKSTRCDRDAGMKLMSTGRAQMVDAVVNNDKAGLLGCAKLILT